MRFMNFLLIALMILAIAPAQLYAGTVDTSEVRQMLTAFDNQDFSIFEEDGLIDSLIEIIETDPVDAPYHDRVIRGALSVLGELQVPEAVDILIGHLDAYPTTCLYWLGTYATPESIEAIGSYLDNEDASVRYEAANALGTIPLDDIGVEVENPDEELITSIDNVLAIINDRLQIEDDSDVADALNAAMEHLSGIE
jgi:HEAT repeat protein